VDRQRLLLQPNVQTQETAPSTETPTPLPSLSPTITPTLSLSGRRIGPGQLPGGRGPADRPESGQPGFAATPPDADQGFEPAAQRAPAVGTFLRRYRFRILHREGSTRFAAIFYGNDASMVGPIRSGRFIDGYLVDGYKAMFAFGFGLYRRAGPVQ